MLEKFLNRVICGDSLNILKEIPNNSIDMIFADPPYNLQLSHELYRPNHSKVNGVDDSWDKFDSFKSYDSFTLNWLKECKRVLKEDGTIWVIGTYHNIFRVGAIMQELDFWILNDIVWVKSNPMPNFKGTRFTNATETLIWATENQKSKYTFNYKSMKVFNDDKQMRSDWYLPICNSKERIKIDGTKAHPTQKPETLLYRVILSSSNEGDTILDPFSGTGTTLAVAKKLKRNFIGIEKDENYINIIEERLKSITPLKSEFLSNKIEKKEPKVAFGALIESEYIRVGEFLYSKDGKFRAKVLANATIEYDGNEDSIHHISSKITNETATNGWLFWYIKRRGKLILLDELRKKYRKEFY